MWALFCVFLYESVWNEGDEPRWVWISDSYVSNNNDYGDDDDGENDDNNSSLIHWRDLSEDDEDLMCSVHKKNFIQILHTWENEPLVASSKSMLRLLSLLCAVHSYHFFSFHVAFLYVSFYAAATMTCRRLWNLVGGCELREIFFFSFTPPTLLFWLILKTVALLIALLVLPYCRRVLLYIYIEFIALGDIDDDDICLLNDENFLNATVRLGT